jgi:hypothetical protein
MDKIPLKYRTWFKGIAPRPIKLALPGWAGNPDERGDGARAQPWHCLPFVEGSTYGLELVYPFDTECRISLADNGALNVEADFSREEPAGMLAESPVSVFAPGHYGVATALDIQPPPGYVLRLEPHPRYFTDTTHTTPCCVPGHLQTEWWPKLFFAVFKNPPPGHTHVFRKGEPYAQLLVVPRRVSYDIAPMTPEQAQARIGRDHAIMNLAEHYLENAWVDHARNPFNDKYKVLSRVFASEGEEGIRKLLEAARQRALDACKHLGFDVISG